MKNLINIKPIIGPTITLPIEVIIDDFKEKTFICVNPIPNDIKIRTIMVYANNITVFITNLGVSI